jgi:hypothetical protein
MDAFWIIITGFLVASSTGMLGNLLLLRRMSMMGDALSHAVLPGIVIAYLISGSRASGSLVFRGDNYGGGDNPVDSILFFQGQDAIRRRDGNGLYIFVCL